MHGHFNQFHRAMVKITRKVIMEHRPNPNYNHPAFVLCVDKLKHLNTHDYETYYISNEGEVP